jgi:7-keto-8-aminopelargonate synthetase-like enzyme
MIPLTPDKQFLLESIKEAKEKGIAHQYLEDQEFAGRVVRIDGKDVLNFGNCCYLGLEINPEVKRGAIEATEKYGSLLSNSRAYFSSPLYTQLEGYLKQIFPGYQVVTTTTTLGHCSVLPLLIEENDEILLDQYVHNSVRMAACICKANGTKITTVRHNDMKHLSTVVRRKKENGARNVWYLADGIYSMQGDLLDIEGLTEVLNEHECLHTYIDDAHGMSWQGKNGAGYVLANGEIHERMVVAVSMCKSFGAFGGIIIFPNRDWAERIRLAGQTLIFSAPISPPILGAAIASARIHLSEEFESLQKDLMDRIRYFRNKCRQANIPVKTKDETPIQFIEIGESSKVFDSIGELMGRGIFVTAAAYPSMPKKHGGIRVSITRHLEFEDIDYLIDQLSDILAYPLAA